jgi:hypothetical protein
LPPKPLCFFGTFRDAGGDTEPHPQECAHAGRTRKRSPQAPSSMSSGKQVRPLWPCQRRTASFGMASAHPSGS